MPMRRENVAAALRYLQDKADLRGRLQRATSLDPQEQDLADIAVETGASLVPGVGPALAARDFERARRANDEAGMAMAAAGAIPGGKLAKLLKGFDPTRLELDVYHGTPHRFPATEANPLGEFDASKIGTGEGAQAYGHGIYLAEAPGTAEIYKRALAEDVVAVDGNRIAAKRSVDARRDPESIAVNALISAQSGQVDDPFATAMQRLGGKYGPRNEYDAKAIEVIRNWRNKGAKIEEGGVMYKADLPDEMIDRMLDWDKPLSKDAPQAIKDAFNKLAQTYPDLKEKLFAAYREGQPGSHYYSLLNDYAKTGDLVKNQTFASDAMRQAGIPGIKYLDAGSRGQGGTGTRNFVVFPGEEKKVRILERDGQKAPPQKIAQALEAASSKTVKAEPQPFGVQGYLNDDLRRVKQNFFSQYGVEENKQFSKDYEVVELAKLKPSENINESKIQSLMKTMREEGNARDNPIPPIIVDSEGNILDGHHRYEAAKRLGAKYVPIVELFDKRKGPVFSE